MTIKQPLNIPIPMPRGKRRYRLVEDYEWTFWRDGNGYVLTIPNGFEYDGASVPRIFWSLSDLTPDGVIRAAATVHDFLYECKGEIPLGMVKRLGSEDWANIHFTRKESDQAFYDIMKESGVNKTSRNRAHWAVRWFGWWAWRT